MNRLLKKEIKVVPVKVLNMRYCRILERAETLDVKDIPVADAREILWIEDELRFRLINLVGHDFYPPDCIENANLLRVPVSNEQKQPAVNVLPTVQAKSEATVDSKINLKVTVKSSIGSKVAEFYVEVDSRNEADLLALKEIRKLGLKKATYKLS